MQVDATFQFQGYIYRVKLMATIWNLGTVSNAVCVHLLSNDPKALFILALQSKDKSLIESSSCNLLMLIRPKQKWAAEALKLHQTPRFKY